MERHERYMDEALALARLAAAAGEVPVGCVIADASGRIIGTGRNRCEERHDATAHAEMEAIAGACRTLGHTHLEDCTLYVTLEPCPMCAGAVINARVGSVVYGAANELSGSCGSVIDLFFERFGHAPSVIAGIRAAESSGLLRDFFSALR